MIIAILAAATFLGGATVIKQARITKVKSDLRLYSTYIVDMFYENPGYTNGGLSKTGDMVASAMNEYLTTDLQVEGAGGTGNSISLKDSWDSLYNFTYSKTENKSEAAILVWSNGADEVNNSSLAGIIPTVENDDIAVLVKMINGEIFILMIDESGITGGDSEGGTL